MPAPQTVEAVTVPIPIAGVNFKDPLQKMTPDSSPWLLNVEPENQYLAVRGAWKVHATITGTGPLAVGLGEYASALYAYTTQSSGNSKIYDVTTSTPSLSKDVGAACLEGYIKPVYHAQKLYFCPWYQPHTCGWYNSAGTWTAFGFTTGGSTLQVFLGAGSYKGRLYFNGSSSSPLVYRSTLGGVTGATDGPVDFSYYTKYLERIYWHATIGSPTNSELLSVIAFGTGGNLSSSTTFVYRGTHPGSSDYEQVGHFKHANLWGVDAVSEVDNDVFIMTSGGIISLKALMTVGEEKTQDITISLPVNKYISDLYKNWLDNLGTGVGEVCAPRVVHWPNKNKYYVLLPGFIDIDGTYINSDATILVKNTQNEAWSIHRLELGFSTVVHSLTLFNEELYFICDNVIMKYDPDSYKDEAFDNPGTYSAYSYAIHSAYFDGASNRKHKKVKTFEPIFETDFDGANVTVKTAADFGRKVSSAASVTLQDGSNNPSYRVGVTGKHLQYRIEGTTDTASTDGFKLYSAALGVG